MRACPRQRVGYDSACESNRPLNTAKEQVMIDMHRIRSAKGFVPFMIKTVLIDEFTRPLHAGDDIDAAILLASLTAGKP